jgi:hypothetical protein
VSILRRIRGVFGMTLLWGAGWSLIGLVLGGGLWTVDRSGLVTGAVVLAAMLRWAALGAMGGAVFALALSVAERGERSADVLSSRRVARWGALGGAVLPLVLLPLFWSHHPGAFGLGVLLVPLSSALGAASASASLHFARRGGARASLSATAT